MAKCEEGYLCDVCGGDVAEIWESDLYLRYVIGQLDPEQLHVTKERHIRCNPATAQFIESPEFEPVTCAGPFDKRLLDSEFVQERETLYTRGWLRLREVVTMAELSLLEYPLPEVYERMQRQAESGPS
jgi:hypothetical protein